MFALGITLKQAINILLPCLKYILSVILLFHRQAWLSFILVPD